MILIKGKKMKNLEFGKALSLLYDFMHAIHRDRSEGYTHNSEFNTIYKDANELLHRNHTELSEYLEYMYSDLDIKPPFVSENGKLKEPVT
jgi:DNA-directed RNA polymerase delta subunit